jgi:hypothetical protein
VYLDRWEKVLDYRRVREYAAENPNAGRVGVGVGPAVSAVIQWRL